jgi:hypothetical protein
VTASALRAKPASTGRRGTAARPQSAARRPLMLSGLLGATAAAGVGLAALTVLVVAGWIAAPHASAGLTGALRTCATLWLVAHHVGISVRGAGRIGMLPLGLVLLPGLLLWRAGRWVVRSSGAASLGQAAMAALAVAAPYSLISGLLAVAARSRLAAPSLPQAMLAGFAVALVAAGLGAARALTPWSGLGGYLPARLRAVLAGGTASLAVLTGAAAILAAVSLAAHVHQYTALTNSLAPGPVGSVLLLAAEIGYLPNAVIWALTFTLGSGFAVGTGTIVTPTGTAVGALPQFPLLAALPHSAHGSPSGMLTALLLAVPYLAGAAGGLLCARAAPTPALEAAPMWGFCCGLVVGPVVGVLAIFAGGPLGDGRLTAIGPSAWQASTLAALEVGVAAAVAAGLANWRLVRAPGRRSRTAQPASRAAGASAAADGSGSRAASRPGVAGLGKNIIYLNRWPADRAVPRDKGKGPAGLP